MLWSAICGQVHGLVHEKQNDKWAVDEVLSQLLGPVPYFGSIKKDIYLPLKLSYNSDFLTLFLFFILLLLSNFSIFEVSIKPLPIFATLSHKAGFDVSKLL